MEPQRLLLFVAEFGHGIELGAVPQPELDIMPLVLVTAGLERFRVPNEEARLEMPSSGKFTGDIAAVIHKPNHTYIM